MRAMGQGPLVQRKKQQHMPLKSIYPLAAGNMKALSSPETPRKRTMRRVPKPLMEKRRRERINHSLETLRLLMLESTRNEKLQNPKVEKAEILESVVHFLKMEKDVERVLSKGQTRARQQTYSDGMRSCLLRVSHFISSTKSQESEDTGNGEKKLNASPPESHKPMTPAGDPAPLTQLPHPYSRSQRTGPHCESRTLGSSTHITDPVWRPWPQ